MSHHPALHDPGLPADLSNLARTQSALRVIQRPGPGRVSGIRGKMISSHCCPAGLGSTSGMHPVKRPGPISAAFALPPSERGPRLGSIVVKSITSKARRKPRRCRDQGNGHEASEHDGPIPPPWSPRGDKHLRRVGWPDISLVPLTFRGFHQCDPTIPVIEGARTRRKAICQAPSGFWVRTIRSIVRRARGSETHPNGIKVRTVSSREPISPVAPLNFPPFAPPPHGKLPRAGEGPSPCPHAKG